MNETEVHTSAAAWIGYWPGPASDNELLALSEVLSQFTTEEFHAAADMLLRSRPERRPAPAELLATLRNVRRDAQAKAADRRGIPEGDPAADPLSWVAKGREALRDALRRVGGKPTA